MILTDFITVSCGKFHSTYSNMANDTRWEAILLQRFGVFDVEQALYKSVMSSTCKPRVFAKAICDALQPTDVPFNLCRLYREAVYGMHPKVRARILNRMNTIAHSLW